ncbi:MAG: ABC transporter permease [Brevinema sp.]
MKRVLAVFKNELRLYYYSWLGWSAFLVINIIASMGYLFGAVSFGNFQHFFSLLEMPFAWAILIVGSRSLARDKEQGLFSLFFTSPISLKEVLFAKFSALAAFFLIIATSLLFYVLLSSIFFKISWMTVLSGFTGLFCIIILFSVFSIFASSCADNTLISIVIGFGLWMLVYLLGSLGNALDPNLPITTIIREISYRYHFNNISSGVFSLSDIFYFFSVTIIMLKITESKILSQTAS